MPVSTRSQSGPLKGDEFYDAVLAWFEAYKQVLQEVERFNLQNHGLWILEEDIDILDSHLAQNSDDELVSSLSKPKSEERVHELELQLQQKLEIPVRQTAFEEYEALRKRFGELRERFRKEGSWISQWANHPKRLKVTPPFGLTPKQAIDLVRFCS
ncbi:uncharacterized protein JCM6883_000888 [Sporobolomyces salmoneus]|uniref:uncharacterized protein n=1 Tax=Sporobolomyces salmoneus TaxID=183962 RepID=UPI003179944A